MITIDGLKEFGADTDSAVKRCVNNEDFYLKQVNKALADTSFEKLKDAIDSKDLDTAFEVAHALKGVWGNLGLTPVFDPVAEMTEHLRQREDMDYSSYMEAIADRFQELKKMTL